MFHEFDVPKVHGLKCLHPALYLAEMIKGNLSKIFFRQVLRYSRYIVTRVITEAIINEIIEALEIRNVNSRNQAAA